MDAIKDDQISYYAYARNRATFAVDPSGRRDFIYPTLVASSSCSSFPGANSFIAEAQKYVASVIEELNLVRCPSTITVYCYQKDTCLLFWKNRECGKSVPNAGSGAHMHINWAPQCSNPKCLILHELIHTCGVTGHKWYGIITIPGCDDNTGLRNHQRGKLSL